MILARPEGGIGVSRTLSTSSTIPTDNAVQNLYLEVYGIIARHPGTDKIFEPWQDETTFFPMRFDHKVLGSLTVPFLDEPTLALEIFDFTMKMPPAGDQFSRRIFMLGGGWNNFGPAMLV